MDILLAGLAVQAVNTLIYIRSHRRLLCGNLALRQQLGIYKRRQMRPGLNNADRQFWQLLSRLWSDCRSVLVIVKPDTIIRWQKKRFRDFWKRKCKPGRPCIPRQHISFIRRISGDHPEYGEDRIALELEVKFGIKHSTATVRKYMVKGQRPRRPSQGWSTFLMNQADAIWTRDFSVQHTVMFTAVYIFVVMHLGSRKVVHINVTEHPTLPWVKQQLRTATFCDPPSFPIHDNDGIFGPLGKPATVEVKGKKVSCRSALDVWLAETMDIRGSLLPAMPPTLIPTSSGSWAPAP
jgi:putative transposase